MALVRSRDTQCELALRTILHRRGLRYFVHRKPSGHSRGRADLLFPSERVAVFVDGCFWHCCPAHASWPKANAAWWQAKLERNRTRDREVDEELSRAGWSVIRIWEHEKPEPAAALVERLVRSKRAPSC
jgi:DNA mismatch endonuclease, patch repair protein